MDKSKWEYKKLGDICEKGSSNIAQNKIEDNTGDYALYGASGYVKSIDFYHQEQPYIGVVKDGSGVGRVNKYPAKSSLLGTMQYIYPKNGCDLGYLLYVLQGLHLEKYKTGAAIPHIYFKDYCKCEVPFPSLFDQQRIVAELDCLNEMIAVKQEQLKEFDKLAQSIFYDMFGDPVTNEKGWDKVFMKQIIKVVGGYAFKSDLFKDNGIPILRIGNINTGEFRPINMVYWIEDDKLSRYVMHPGDLVLSLTGTVGKDDYGNVCILDNSYDRYYLNQRNAKLEIIGNVEKLYLSRLLKIDEVKAKLTGTSRGVRQANISNKDIENLIIPLPPLSLQQQFADKISAIEAQKELVKQSIAETQTLLDYTMDYYFN